MKSYLFKIMFLVFVITICSLEILAQNKNTPTDSEVVFGKTGDRFPDKMKISGTITDLTFSSGCGVLATAGTLKIKLDKKIKDYPFEIVYVVKSCLGDFEKFRYKRKRYVGKRIDIEVTKLLEEYYYSQIKDINKVPCAFDVIHNDFNSNGIPFYCTDYNIASAIKK